MSDVSDLSSKDAVHDDGISDPQQRHPTFFPPSSAPHPHPPSPSVISHVIATVVVEGGPTTTTAAAAAGSARGGSLSVSAAASPRSRSIQGGVSFADGTAPGTDGPADATKPRSKLLLQPARSTAAGASPATAASSVSYDSDVTEDLSGGGGVDGSPFERPHRIIGASPCARARRAFTSTADANNGQGSFGSALHAQTEYPPTPGGDISNPNDDEGVDGEAARSGPHSPTHFDEYCEMITAGRRRERRRRRARERTRSRADSAISTAASFLSELSNLASSRFLNRSSAAASPNSTAASPSLFEASPRRRSSHAPSVAVSIASPEQGPCAPTLTEIIGFPDADAILTAMIAAHALEFVHPTTDPYAGRREPHEEAAHWGFPAIGIRYGLSEEPKRPPNQPRRAHRLVAATALAGGARNRGAGGRGGGGGGDSPVDSASDTTAGGIDATAATAVPRRHGSAGTGPNGRRTGSTGGGSGSEMTSFLATEDELVYGVTGSGLVADVIRMRSFIDNPDEQNLLLLLLRGIVRRLDTASVKEAARQAAAEAERIAAQVWWRQAAAKVAAAFTSSSANHATDDDETSSTVSNQSEMHPHRVALLALGLVQDDPHQSHHHHHHRSVSVGSATSAQPLLLLGNPMQPAGGMAAAATHTTSASGVDVRSNHGHAAAHPPREQREEDDDYKNNDDALCARDRNNGTSVFDQEPCADDAFPTPQLSPDVLPNAVNGSERSTSAASSHASSATRRANGDDERQRTAAVDSFYGQDDRRSRAQQVAVAADSSSNGLDGGYPGPLPADAVGPDAMEAMGPCCEPLTAAGMTAVDLQNHCDRMFVTRAKDVVSAFTARNMNLGPLPIEVLKLVFLNFGAITTDDWRTMWTLSHVCSGWRILLNYAPHWTTLRRTVLIDKYASPAILAADPETIPACAKTYAALLKDKRIMSRDNLLEERALVGRRKEGLLAASWRINRSVSNNNNNDSGDGSSVSGSGNTGNRTSCGCWRRLLPELLTVVLLLGVVVVHYAAMYGFVYSVRDVIGDDGNIGAVAFFAPLPLVCVARLLICCLPRRFQSEDPEGIGIGIRSCPIAGPTLRLTTLSTLPLWNVLFSLVFIVPISLLWMRLFDLDDLREEGVWRLEAMTCNQSAGYLGGVVTPPAYVELPAPLTDPRWLLVNTTMPSTYTELYTPRRAEVLAGLHEQHRWAQCGDDKIGCYVLLWFDANYTTRFFDNTRLPESNFLPSAWNATTYSDSDRALAAELLFTIDMREVGLGNFLGVSGGSGRPSIYYNPTTRADIQAAFTTSQGTPWCQRTSSSTDDTISRGVMVAVPAGRIIPQPYYAPTAMADPIARLRWMRAQRDQDFAEQQQQRAAAAAVGTSSTQSVVAVVGRSRRLPTEYRGVYKMRRFDSERHPNQTRGWYGQQSYVLQAIAVSIHTGQPVPTASVADFSAPNASVVKVDATAGLWLPSPVARAGFSPVPLLAETSPSSFHNEITLFYYQILWIDRGLLAFVVIGMLVMAACVIPYSTVLGPAAKPVMRVLWLVKVPMLLVCNPFVVIGFATACTLLGPTTPSGTSAHWLMCNTDTSIGMFVGGILSLIPYMLVIFAFRSKNAE